MRRILMLAGVVVAAVALVVSALVPAGAGQPTMIVVRTTVQGPATGGFTVLVSCGTEQATLNFDASGAPTTFSASDTWSIVNGAWNLSINPPDDPLSCTATETDPDGAATTSWTCDFQAVVEGMDPPGGCDAGSGTGTGPVGFTLNGISNQVMSQTATVHFTNTVPAPAVEAAPTFTG